jgi:hypothetical protein
VPENPRIEELRRRVLADPASIAFAALAEEFRRCGRNEEAIETCRQGLQRHPAYLSARVTLGRALIEVGDYEDARTELELVLQSAPENLVAIRGLAQVHERLGHSTEMHPDLHALVQDGEARRDEEQARRREEQARREEEQARREEEQARREEEQARRREEEQRAAAAAAAAVAVAPARSAALDELNLDSLEISLDIPAPPAASESTAESFDIFAAALERTPLPAPSPLTEHLFAPAPEPAPVPAASAATEAAADAEPIAAPDPHVAATLMRLERLLDAIQTARRA